MRVEIKDENEEEELRASPSAVVSTNISLS
jgi:hypothetical protein